MADHTHISLPYFLEVIEKRLDEYREAIFGTRQSFGANHTMLTAKLHNMQTLKRLIEQNNLTAGEFWGYGINHISDGEEKYSCEDVEVIKRNGQQNKHLEPYRNLLLLLFKVEKGAFSVSTFVIDSCAPIINSTINTCYNLSELTNARMRTRAQALFVDIYFTSVPKPVSFQIETYHLAGNHYSGEALGNYYINGIEMIAKRQGEPAASKLFTHMADLKTTPQLLKLSVTGYALKILQYLFKQPSERGSVYGTIASSVGLDSAAESEKNCDNLYFNGFAELRNNRVIISDSGRKWLEQFYEEQNAKIRQFVYDDYNFSLLRFLFEQDIPIRFKDFPEIFVEEAPKNTDGYPSMNLHYMLEIKFRPYIDNSTNKYELNESGRKYFEHLAKQKNISLNRATETANKKNVSKIFISYAHDDQQWLQKVQVHLKALKNYGQIKFDHWDDTHMIAGDRWETAIEEELQAADVAILLISTKFFASDFIKARELAPLLQKAEGEGTRIIPLIISHSIFSSTPLGKFHAVNDSLQPLNTLTEGEQDKILVKMCGVIEKHLLEAGING